MIRLMSNKVRPKKNLGQHFLTDQQTAQRITEALTGHGGYNTVLEIGPGMGVLTQYLLPQPGRTLYAIELDRDSVAYLSEHFAGLQGRLIEGDFLKIPLPGQLPPPFAVIGNFPYNISSQIFFRILDVHPLVPEVVCMLQKEVADRIASPPGSKAYGILSVLLQAWYSIDKVLNVGPGAFHPPPKVQSAVIRLRHNGKTSLGCDEQLFRRVVKQGFQNRRKTLRKALKALNLPEPLLQDGMLSLRAEQLSVDDFILLTNKITGV